jgi:hypothetical protein
MSVQYYYQDGMHLSATLKADYRRVRAKNPKRYVKRKVTEQRMGPDGNTVSIVVNAEPDAVPMSAFDRHNFANNRRR